MEISEYLTPQRITILDGATKASALAELAGLLAGGDLGVTQQQLERAIWQREEMMSTGIGHGLGIPHVRMRELKTIAMAVGVSQGGIRDYPSLDEKPVYIIVLIAAPEGQHEAYIRLLAEATEVLKHDELRQAVVQAENPQQVYDILTGAKP